MAVETRYGSGYRDPTKLDPINSINRCAELRAVNSTVEVGDGDEPGSRYFVGYVPSNGLMDTGSMVLWDACGVTASLGFKGNPNAFGTYDMTAAGGGPIADVLSQDTDPGTNYGISDLDEPFWSQANMPRDPGGELELILTVDAGAGVADAKIKVVFKFFRQG